MPRLRPLALLSAVALAAALAPAALAGAAVPNGSDRADVRARAEHDRIVAFWTPERMAAATPRDFVRQADGTFRLAPAPLDALATTSGASWTVANDSTGGDVQKRTGKVYFVMGRSGYVCSGAVAGNTAAGNALVLTAGHCLYDGSRYSKRTPNAGFATNWLFIPDFDALPNLSTSNCASAQTKYGCWTASALVVHSSFATQKTFTSTATKYDFGFAVVGLGGNGGRSDLEDVVGGGYRVDTKVEDPSPRKGDPLSAFGYPAAAPYDGKVLTYCSGQILEDSRNGNATWGMPCTMTGGSSGGPWLYGVDSTGAGGTLSSLNSYGYSGIPTMYGPKFNSATQLVYDYAQLAAGSSTPESRVVS